MGGNVTSRSNLTYPDDGETASFVGQISTDVLQERQARPQFGKANTLRVVPRRRVESPNCATLVIVDQRAMLTEALAFSLRTLGIEVVGIEPNIDRVVDLVRTHEPDAVLLGERAARAGAADRLLQSRPALKIILLVSELVNRSSGFVHAVLSRHSPLGDFAAGVHAVTRGTAVATRSSASGGSPEDGLGPRGNSRLTKRELEVLALLTGGVNTRAMSCRLSISTNTVRTHIQHILVKLHVHSQIEAVAAAREQGLVSPSSSFHDSW